ncbi:hypothetical protein [Halarcobacter sp.]|uniref:hypothetical protein n=1 Tax=Halarcobacter sp. TaxID=2321133 RepID=UPI002AAADCEC|nr:hypothetical protein [Halarcobacter sp.]
MNNKNKTLYDIKEVTKACSKGETVSFAITSKNKYSLFLFTYYQYKYNTNKEFKHISYQKPKDLLFYFLKLVSKISFGYYKLTYDYNIANCNKN